MVSLGRWRAFRHPDSSTSLGERIMRTFLRARFAFFVLFGAVLLAGCSKGKSVEELSKQLESPKPNARHHAVRELRDMGPKAKDAVPALAKALKDNDPKVRKKAAQALRE